MSRTHPRVTSVSETEQFLSEKAIAKGSVIVVTWTSDSAFAAKNLTVYGRRDTLG